MSTKSTNHWYPRYTGDFQRKTAHLSMSQVGAFDRLLDWYYSNEKPLPLDWVQMHRICGAVAPHEQDDVQTVVNEFFEHRPDGWHNAKADEQIEKRTGISEKRRKAQAIRESNRVASEGAKEGANAPSNADTSTPTSTVKDKRVDLIDSFEGQGAIAQPTDHFPDTTKMVSNVPRETNLRSPGHDPVDLYFMTFQPQPVPDHFVDANQKIEKRKETRLYDEFPKCTTAEEFADQLPPRWLAVAAKFIDDGEYGFQRAFALGFWEQYVGAYPGAEVAERYPEKENWFRTWEHAAENQARKVQGLPPKRVMGSKAAAAMQKKSGAA